ncbi:7TM diverse intracellular signaling domain-containing protein [Polaromonas sp.]|uniref:7TM diverse intracellular signaling domain-containing protein n=1 Tax=Polaromonas sp. TaxID=1869339 RepID=UPI003263441F
MRYATGLLAALLLAVLSGLLGAASFAQPIVILDDQHPVTDLQASALTWMDSDAQATITQLAASNTRPPMSPAQAHAVYALGPQSALWQHYRFKKSAHSQQDWVLQFPLPLLDQVTVFQQTPTGGWIGETAGDTVAVSTWPESGRYPQFHLALTSDGVRDVYVRVQHATRVNIPVRAISGKARSHGQQVEAMASGMMLGALLLLIVAGAAQSLVYRDPAYGWYALYVAVMTLVAAAWTGVASQLLWSGSGGWADLAPGCLSLLAAGAAPMVVHHLCGTGTGQKWLAPVAYWLGAASLPLAITYAMVERGTGVIIAGAYVMVVLVLGMRRAIIVWKGKDMVGFWVLAAFMPLALAALLTLAGTSGLLPVSALSQYGLLAGLTLQVPLLLVALNLRSRERHSMEAREQAMASQDALTGLLTPHLFNDRLHRVVSRATRHGEPAAVVYVELANYDYVKRTHGTAVAEQSLLRSVIKLRRILRDVDTVGRVDEARFGLIMEGASTREPVTDMAARLIASGLMPLKGLKPEVILQFHVAGVLLTEKLANGPELSQALAHLLDGMAARTRRPIRFLEPELTRPMPLEEDSTDESNRDSDPIRNYPKL